MNIRVNKQLKGHHHAMGFTLVEMMLTLTVIAVLAAISMQLYSTYVIKTNRTTLQSQMTQIAQKLAGFKLVNNNYNVALTSTAIYGSNVYPAAGIAQYDLTLDTTVPGAWTLTAIPKTGTKQAGDGAVLLNDQGWQCWTKTSTACTLSATSKW